MSAAQGWEFDGLGRSYVISSRASGLHAREAASLVRERAEHDRLFRTALADWAADAGHVWSLGDERRIVAELLRMIEDGELSVHADDQPAPPVIERRPLPRSLGTVPTAAPSLPVPPPPLVHDEIVDDHRSLLITHCPPQFDPRRESLRVAYLLRDLQGKHVELIVRSQARPEPPVHRRALAAGETVDGPNDLEWDGRDDAGELVARDLAPFMIELVHDASCRSEAQTTLPPAEVVPIVEFGPACFTAGGIMLLPDIDPDVTPEPGRTRASGLAAVETVLVHARNHTDARVFVIGHAEAGEAPELALARAESLKLYLAGDFDGWSVYGAVHGQVIDRQRVLAWIARRLPDYDCDPGPLDGIDGPKTRAAQANFRAAHGRLHHHVFPPTDMIVPEDWRAFASLYDAALQQLLGLGVDLASQRAGLRFSEPAARSYGRSFANDRAGAEGDRRVDVAFLDARTAALARDSDGVALYRTPLDVVREYMPYVDSGATAAPRLHVGFAVPDTLRCGDDSALLMPAPWTDGRHPLAAIVRASVALIDDPEAWLVVVGHASAPGGEAHNQQLSEQRAAVVRAFIEGDRDAWVELAREHGSLRDVIAYLDHLGCRRAWSCIFDGELANITVESDATRRTVAAFQSDFNARLAGALKVDGVCGRKTLAAVFDVFAWEFERWLAKLGSSADELPRERIVYRGHGSTLAGRGGGADDPGAADRIVDLIVVHDLPFDDTIATADLYDRQIARRSNFEIPDDDWATGPFTIVSDLTLSEPAAPETYELRSTDGSWSIERVLPDDGELESGELVLRFDALPTELSYSLTVTSAGGRRSVIFEDVPYGELHRLAAGVDES